MSLTLQTAPTELPVTIDEVKDQTRYTESDQDAVFYEIIRAIVSQLDGAAGLLNRALITQTWALTFDQFPSSGKRIKLPLPPVQSITSIQYIDENGATQTWAASKYKLLNANNATRPAMIEEAHGEAYPSTRDEGEAVTITFVAGYGARNDVPWHTRHLIKMMVAAAWCDRTGFDPAPGTASAMERLFSLARFTVVA